MIIPSMFIMILYDYRSVGQSKDYFKRKNRENYLKKKKYSEDYRLSSTNESFSEYVRKIRKQKR